jgi:hypothetical protein
MFLSGFRVDLTFAILAAPSRSHQQLVRTG